MTEETPLRRLEGRYLKALRHHIRRDAGASQTRRLGAHAVSMGLETLDLARIHDWALVRLLPASSTPAERHEMTTRAVGFFSEVVIPLEETHRIALEASEDLKQLCATLNERTQALMDSNRELEEKIGARKTAEATLQTSEQAFGQLLTDSLLLEKNLQEMTRKILVSNEEGRKNMSLQLHDEIAQTLLGIHVKLLSLKREAAASHLGLAQKIATIQRLVAACVETINRFVHEFGPP